MRRLLSVHHPSIFLSTRISFGVVRARLRSLRALVDSMQMDLQMANARLYDELQTPGRDRSPSPARVRLGPITMTYRGCRRANVNRSTLDAYIHVPTTEFRLKTHVLVMHRFA